MLEQPAHELLYWEHARRHQAIRMGDWKGVRHGLNKPLELYDLASDPGETTDVADEHAGLVSALLSLMESERTPSEHFPLR